MRVIPSHGRLWRPTKPPDSSCQRRGQKSRLRQSCARLLWQCPHLHLTAFPAVFSVMGHSLSSHGGNKRHGPTSPRGSMTRPRSYHSLKNRIPGLPSLWIEDEVPVATNHCEARKLTTETLSTTENTESIPAFLFQKSSTPPLHSLSSEAGTKGRATWERTMAASHGNH